MGGLSKLAAVVESEKRGSVMRGAWGMSRIHPRNSHHGNAVHSRGGHSYSARMNAELLAILRCPETRQPLAIAASEVVARLNAQIVAGSLRNQAGKLVAAKLDGALARADGKALYPVRNNVPVLLVDEAILP
jgi:uncharacterized protein